MQEPDGNWDDPKGWGHLMWGGAGFKAWAAMEHYRLTGDREFLARVYPRLAASSRWQERQRSRTRTTQSGERPLTYGLMPRGMGDCGLMDDGDLYGVFLWDVGCDHPGQSCRDPPRPPHGDAAARYLYATLNHATPLVTWCEGAVPNAVRRNARATVSTSGPLSRWSDAFAIAW